MNTLTNESQSFIVRSELRVPPETDLHYLLADLRSQKFTGDIVVHVASGGVQSVTLVQENRARAKLFLTDLQDTP